MMKFFMGLFFWGSLFAQDSLNEEKFKRIQQIVSDANLTSEVVEKVSVGSLIIQLIFGLSVVLGLLYVALRLMKHLQNKTTGQNNTSDFQLLQTFHLGPQQRIQKVVLYGKVYLLGVTNESINVLDELGDEPALDQAVNAKEFAGNVDYFLKRFKKNQPSSLSREDEDK